MYCTIITGGYGAPHRYYVTKQAALAAAQRHSRRTADAMEVAWCRAGNPKVWLAYVTSTGTSRTSHWSDDAR